jgi:opacity protein-like surface antigen
MNAVGLSASATPALITSTQTMFYDTIGLSFVLVMASVKLKSLVKPV